MAVNFSVPTVIEGSVLDDVGVESVLIYENEKELGKATLTEVGQVWEVTFDWQPVAKGSRIMREKRTLSSSPDAASERPCGTLTRVSSGQAAVTKRSSKPAQLVSAVRRMSEPLYWLYQRRLMRAVKANGALPKHIGIIMDGNRRFAKTVGLDLKAGHDYGASKAREVLDWCLELGIQHVTLWGFSTDNRGRTSDEVQHLHSLFAAQAQQLIDDPRVHKNKVRVRIIGDIEDFPEEAREVLRLVEKKTEAYEEIHLNVALGYGGREEIVSAVRKLLKARAKDGCDIDELVDAIDAEEIGRHLYTAGMPDPDFVIRTSGEVRMSGFLLWQTAYSEFYFCDAFWPEFRKIDFLRAMRSFQARERRFGR